MIYSKEKKFLFIHIPKTAGTSIRSVLEPYGGKPGMANYIARRLEKSPDLCFAAGLTNKRTFDGHTTYKKVSKLIPKVELSSLFVFAFVRNPYDRLYSFYLHILAHPEHPWHLKIKNYGSFHNMLLHLQEVNEPTQKSYLISANNKVMTNFIGRFENIETDFGKICETLSIPFSLPKKNTRSHKNWREAYQNDDWKYAADFYKEDFEAFGYDMNDK